MKHHGRLKKWIEDRGFGFIQSPQHEEEIFVHISAFPKNGRKPKIGELVAFEIQTDNKGRKRAIKVQTSVSKRSNVSRSPKGGSVVGTVFTLVGLAVAGFFAFEQVTDSRAVDLMGSEGSMPEPLPARPAVYAPAPESVIHNFRCDGRQYCSQMTSLEEAEFFLRNCPDPKMDGDRDGIPCENDSRFR